MFGKELNIATKWLAAAVILGFLLWVTFHLSGVFTPFVVSFAIAYIINPVVEKIQSLSPKIPRILAVSLVFLLLSLLLLIVVLVVLPPLNRQLQEFIAAIPAGVHWVQTIFLPKIASLIGVESVDLQLDSIVQAGVKNLSKAANVAAFVGNALFQSGLTLVNVAINLGMIVVVTFYLLKDWEKILSAMQKVIPRSLRANVIQRAKQSDEVLSAFLRGQLSVMLALGVIYSVGLTLVGVKFSILLGLGAGLLSIVPYLGGIVGVLVTTLVAFFDTHTILSVLLVLLVFGVGQALEGMVLTPLLVGDKLGLHPVAVIFAILAGGQLFGFTGILLALPIAAVLLVLFREPVVQWAQAN